MDAKRHKANKDLLTSISQTWANNPKLLQVLNQIDFSHIKDVFKEKKLRQELSVEDSILIENYYFDPSLPKDDAYFSDLFSILDAPELTILFEQANHRFNRAEIQFILDSWNEKEQRVAQLRRERDEARAESRRAGRLARSNNNSLKTLQMDKTNPTLALRMAEANYLLYPESRSAVGIFLELFNNKDKAKTLQTIKEKRTTSIYSPDGQTLLKISNDNTVKLLDLSQSILQIFRGHADTVTSVAYALDGQKILTGSKDRTAKLWDLQGRELQTFKGHLDTVTLVAFSPDEQTVLTGSKDSTDRLWDLQGKALYSTLDIPAEMLEEFLGTNDIGVDTVDYHEPMAVFSPDGNFLLRNDNDGIASLHDLLQWKPLHTFEGHTGNLTALVFSPDGQSILTGSEDKTAKLWDLQGKVLQTFRGHTNAVTSLAFSPDGQSILTGSEDKTAKLWDLQGKVLQTFRGHTNAVTSLAFSPNGQSITTWSAADELTKSWNLQGKEWQGKALQNLKDNFFEKGAVFFSLSGKTIHIGKRLWNLKGQELTTSRGGGQMVSILAASPDNKNTLRRNNNDVELWDWYGNRLQVFQGHTYMVNVASFSPDGKSILTGSRDKTAKLWDLQGQEQRTFQVDGEVGAVIFSPDGKIILVKSKYKKAVKLWDLQGEELQSFQAHVNTLTSVVFSPNSQFLLIGSEDNTAKLLDLNGQERQLFRGHTSSVTTVAFSPDGKTILTGSEDKTTKLWDLQGEELQSFQGHTKVSRVVFSPDGYAVLTVFRDYTAKLWLTPLGYIAENVELYSKDELKLAGLEFGEEEDWSYNQIPTYNFDDVLSLEDSTQLAIAATYFEDRAEWEKALLLYEKSLRRDFRCYLLFDLYKIAKQRNNDFNFQRFLNLDKRTELIMAADFFSERKEWEKAKELYEKANEKALKGETQIKIFEIAKKLKQPLKIAYFLQNQSLKEINLIIAHYRIKRNTSPIYWIKSEKMNSTMLEECLKNYEIIYALIEHAIALDEASKQLYKTYALDMRFYANFQILNRTFVAAEKTAKRSLALDSDNMDIYCQIALILFCQGRYEAAEQLLKKGEEKYEVNSFIEPFSFSGTLLSYLKLLVKEKIIPEIHQAKIQEITNYYQMKVSMSNDPFGID